VIWILDVDRYKLTKRPDANALVRMFAFTMHALCFDMDAQRNGVIIVEDLAFVGFGKIMKMFPMDAKRDIDKLSQGASSMRMHKFCIVRSP